jgi:hypothetical protein
MLLCRLLPALSVASLAAALHACGVVHDEAIDGPYRLEAVDADDEMAVYYCTSSDECIGRVDRTVFAVGWDRSYIVAARHPAGDRGRTEYYYLVRALDGRLVDPSVSVRGPLSADEFRKESSRLGLPSLRRKISRLE